jgi:16S rRNA (cytosine1402-N4)-methyltransferase
MVHTPVLLREVIDGLSVKRGDVVLDGTVGGGGHSEALCTAAKGGLTVVCLDADSEAIERSKVRLSKLPCSFRFVETNFRHLDEVLASLGIPHVDRILLDLGLSSDQLLSSGRGFSFRGSEPLAMTFARPFGKEALTAGRIVNEWGEENIATIIERYGDERAAKRIAAAIVRERAIRPIRTTGELRELIERVLPRRSRIHPATKTFQALRMAVNDELNALQEGLAKGWQALRAGGRFAVISFHSHEDRIVKQFFREKAKRKEGLLVFKKPFAPTQEEQHANPRARSAKLRIIEKTS